jgi:Asp-tRNA(Asn)/Glu-tRNA(Gln) amidotransferase A subunit family amidase
MRTTISVPARCRSFCSSIKLVDIIIQITQYTGLFNAAGAPCTAQPVQAAGSRIPASLQLVGPLRGEELLLATALRIEAAMA